MRKKLITLITGAIVAAALALPATAAFAIHDPNVPAGTDTANKGCSHSGARSVGDPSPAAGNPDQPLTSLVHSNQVLIAHNNANPPCHNDPN